VEDNTSDSLFAENEGLSAQQDPKIPATGEKTNIELHGILFEGISVAGLTPMELVIVANAVNDTIKKLEKECVQHPETGGIDTLRLALLSAFQFAAALYQAKQTVAHTERAIDRTIERLGNAFKID